MDVGDDSSEDEMVPPTAKRSRWEHKGLKKNLEDLRAKVTGRVSIH